MIIHLCHMIYCIFHDFTTKMSPMSPWYPFYPTSQASGQPVQKQSKRFQLHRATDGTRNWGRGCQFGRLFPTSPEHAESLSNALVKGTAPPANAAKPIWTAHHFASATVRTGRGLILFGLTSCCCLSLYTWLNDFILFMFLFYLLHKTEQTG